MKDRLNKMKGILEGLLAYAVAHGDKAEEERIRAELVRKVEAL